MNKKELSKKQLSEKLNVSTTSIQNWEKEGMPSKRISGISKVKYDLENVMDWLSKRQLKKRGKKLSKNTIGQK